MTRVLPELKTLIESYELVPSDGGRFEISVDGKLVYSKLSTGQFPDEEEILAQLRQLAS